MLVLGAIVDQEEQAGGREALDEPIEHGLALGVDPVQILDEDEEGLDLALAHQEALDAVEGALATLSGVEAFPLGIVDGDVEESQEGRPPGLELAVQGAQLAGDLLADAPAVIAGLDLEVALEQIDDG